MLTGQPNEDFTTGGLAALQQKIRALLANYVDIFSFNVKGKAMDFTVDATRWEVPTNHLPSRHISLEKHLSEQND